MLAAETDLPSRKSNPDFTPLQPAENRDLPQFATDAGIHGLYLHIPFCFHKCHYCDFYSIVDQAPHQDGRQDAFIHALIGEIRGRAQFNNFRPRTLFIGGGTPTLLRADLWKRLLGALRAVGWLDHIREFTVEANPETVTPDLLRLLAGHGVNRLSIGAQSFQPDLLRTLERWHDPANVPRAVETARDAGVANINLDLIFAIPGQTAEDLERDLDAALACGPTHLSCYSLIFEPQTALARKRDLGRIQPADEALERDQYRRVIRRLAGEGFEHYEISNWARPGRRCEHNLTYWLNRNYLGLGPSASSHIDGRRWKNAARLGDYIAGSPDPPTEDHEQLSPDASFGEQLMLRLRLIDGAPLDWLEPRLDPRRRAEVDRFLTQGLLDRTDTHLRLSETGLFVADALIARLL